MAETFRVGLLGHGTVGSAFATLLAQRADAIVPITGMRPEITGVLTRSQGSFEEVLEHSDLIVELIGGIDPARDYVLRAMRAGRHVVSANKQLLSQHGEELWACAREHGVQLRFEGAVAGVVPVIRVLQESLAGARVDRVHEAIAALLRSQGVDAQRRGSAPRSASPEARRPFLCFADSDPEDIVSRGAKIVGSAQRRRSDAILQQGALLLERSPTTPGLLGAVDLTPTASSEPRQWSSILVDQLPAALGLVPAIELLPAAIRRRGVELERTVYRNDSWNRKR